MFDGSALINVTESRIELGRMRVGQSKRIGGQEGRGSIVKGEVCGWCGVVVGVFVVRIEFL